MIDRENFNSGDKFLLTKSNVERTEFFHSRGMKHLKDFKPLANCCASYNRNNHIKDFFYSF